MQGRRYRSIKAWQLADNLAVAVYEATASFPKDERYGVVSQMRRAGVSVAANIAEGASRSSKKEYLQFLSISRGSLAELRYYLHLAKRLGYLTDRNWEKLEGSSDEVGRVLYGLARSIEGAVFKGERVPTVV